MEPAFWDSSALVPLCVQQVATPAAHALAQFHTMVVWWAAPVEIHGAFARLLRIGQLTSSQHVGAQVRFAELRCAWREVSPGRALRDEAERLIDLFSLKGADALQLAAAMSWCSGRPTGRIFISGDSQLLAAAEQLGFQALRS